MNHTSSICCKSIFLFCVVAWLIPQVAIADSICTKDEDSRTMRFMESIQANASKIVESGQFFIAPIDIGGGKKKFDVAYRVGATVRFKLSVVPHSKEFEEFDMSTIRTHYGGALLSQIGSGGSAGISCGYFIHSVGGRFRAEKIEGIFSVADINADGLDEIVKYEPQDWSSDCGTNISWRRIYQLDANGAKLVDSSDKFPTYYLEAEKDLRGQKKQYEREGSARRECLTRFDAIIAQAHSFTGSKAVAEAPVAQDSRPISGRWVAPDGQSMELSANSMKQVSMACDEGRCQLTAKTTCKWSNLHDELRASNGDGLCHISEGAVPISKAEVIRGFDERLRAESSNDRGFLATAKRNRSLIDSMKPVPLRHFIVNESGDVYDLYFDGEHFFGLASMGIGATRFGRSR